MCCARAAIHINCTHSLQRAASPPDPTASHTSLPATKALQPLLPTKSLLGNHTTRSTYKCRSETRAQRHQLKGAEIKRLLSPSCSSLPTHTGGTPPVSVFITKKSSTRMLAPTLGKLPPVSALRFESRYFRAPHRLPAAHGRCRACWPWPDRPAVVNVMTCCVDGWMDPDGVHEHFQAPVGW